MKKNLLIIAHLFLLFSCGPENKSQTKKEQVPYSISSTQKELYVIGFFKGKAEEIDAYDYGKLTHLIFCFTHLKENKMCLDEEKDEAALKKCVDLKKKFPHLKVMISFGGWGGCEFCSDVFATDSNRKTFAGSVKDFLDKYNLDGLDLDWESPVIGGYGKHAHSENDYNNFTALSKEIRTALNKDQLLCFDANCFDEYMAKSIDWKNVMSYMNWVNVMSYGLPSDTDGFTGHHAALYSSKNQRESADKGVRFLDSLGVPAEKIVIGAAFYAIASENANKENFGLKQAGKTQHDLVFKRLGEKYPSEKGFYYHWDSVSKVPWLYSESEKTFVSFDDSLSVALKTKYAKEKKLAGIMFWKLNGDKTKHGLLDAIYREKKSSK